MPDSPGWATGYVPPASEWNNEFASKVDYPAPPEQGGTGGLSAAEGAYNLAQRFLVTADESPLQLSPITFYGLRTATGVITLNLPALATLTLGDWIELADIDYDAATNNVTLNAFSGDTITLYGSAAASQLLNVSGAKITLVANTTSWCMLV